VVLHTLIGPSKEVRSPAKASNLSTPVKPESPVPSLLAKKLEREKETSKVDKNSDSEKTSQTGLPPVPAPVLETPAVNHSEKRQEPEKSKESEVKIENPHVKSETPDTVNPKSGIAPRTKSDTASPKQKSHEKTSSRIDLSEQPQEVREKHRQELVEQLKIQLSAYNDYLREQLQLQQDELQRIHLVALEEKVLEEKMKYQRELASSIVRLQEIENVLKGKKSITDDSD
jgi:hypothetical protein